MCWERTRCHSCFALQHHSDQLTFAFEYQKLKDRNKTDVATDFRLSFKVKEQKNVCLKDERQLF